LVISRNEVLSYHRCSAEDCRITPPSDAGFL
jgi:hypothetical protein